MDRLIKGDGGPRPITKDALAEALLCQDDPEQTTFERSADRALLVGIAPLAIPICVLLLFWIWWSHPVEHIRLCG